MSNVVHHDHVWAFREMLLQLFMLAKNRKSVLAFYLGIEITVMQSLHHIRPSGYALANAVHVNVLDTENPSLFNGKYAGIVIFHTAVFRLRLQMHRQQHQ